MSSVIVAVAVTGAVEKQKNIRMSFLSEFTVLRALSVSVFGLQLGWFRLWLSSAFSFLFVFLVFFGFLGGWGVGGGGMLTSMAMCGL